MAVETRRNLATRRKRRSEGRCVFAPANPCFRWWAQRRQRVRWKEPVGRLETRPLPRGRDRGLGSKASEWGWQVGSRCGRNAPPKKPARHRLKPPSSPRCRAPRRAGHGCRGSIPRVGRPCRYFVGVTWTAADGIVGPILSLRPLSGPGTRLQPLRPGPDLLRR